MSVFKCASVFERCSFDGVPFLLHDPTFRRTTNIADVFPELTDVEACWLNMSQIKRLDAGSWFLRVSTQYCLRDVALYCTDVERLIFICVSSIGQIIKSVCVSVSL